MLVDALRDVQPAAPPRFLEWGVKRIDYTIHLLRHYLPDGAAVMDLASGAHFSYLVTNALPHLHWIPTDAEPHAATFTKHGQFVYEYQPIPFLLEPDTRALPRTELDAVTLFEVVEHLPWNPARLFGAVNESLKKEGLFILSTPNIGSRIAILRALSGGSPHQTPFLETGFWFHKREYGPWELRELVRWAGFDIVSHTTRNVTRAEGLHWRAAVHHVCLLAAAVLSLHPAEVRHLLRFSGSTQFLVCRKMRAPRWDAEPLKV